MSTTLIATFVEFKSSVAQLFRLISDIATIICCNFQGFSRLYTYSFFTYYIH